MAELYILTSPIGKQYVGITYKTADWRFIRHSSNSLAGRNSCRLLNNALRKHGPENFIVKTLVVGDFQYILDLEQAAILVFGTMAPNGYNLREGGQGGKMSEETRRKISKLARERHLRNPEIARRHAACIRGRKHTPETIEKMRQTRGMPEWKAKSRAAHLGNTASEETKAKMSIAAKKRASISEETRRNMSEAAKRRGMPRHVIEASANASRGKSQSKERKKTQSERMKQWWKDRKTGGASSPASA